MFSWVKTSGSKNLRPHGGANDKTETYRRTSSSVGLLLYSFWMAAVYVREKMPSLMTPVLLRTCSALTDQQVPARNEAGKEEASREMGRRAGGMDESRDRKLLVSTGPGWPGLGLSRSASDTVSKYKKLEGGQGMKLLRPAHCKNLL